MIIVAIPDQAPLTCEQKAAAKEAVKELFQSKDADQVRAAEYFRLGDVSGFILKRDGVERFIIVQNDGKWQEDDTRKTAGLTLAGTEC